MNDEERHVQSMTDQAGRTYALRHNLASRVLTFIPVLLFVASAVTGVVLLLIHGFGMPGAVIGAVFIGLLGFGSWMQLRVPHTIEWKLVGTIEFRSRLGKTLLTPNEIVSIGLVANQLGYLELRYGERKLVLLNQFDDFHEFLSRLKRENPEVRLQGC